MTTENNVQGVTTGIQDSGTVGSTTTTAQNDTQTQPQTGAPATVTQVADIRKALQAMNGKELLAFFRLFEERTLKDAGRIPFMTEHSISMEKETDSTVTVDGNVNSLADGENKMELSAIAHRILESDIVAFWEEMHQWFLDGKLVEFWQVDIENKRTNKQTQKEEYKVNYFQGKFTNFEMEAAADGNVELTFEFAINGNGIWRQWDSLTDEQLEAVKENQYVYHTLGKETDI